MNITTVNGSHVRGSNRGRRLLVLELSIEEWGGTQPCLGRSWESRVLRMEALIPFSNTNPV